MANFQDIVIQQGTSFIHDINVVDSSNAAVNISGYAVNSVMRRYYGSNTYIAFTTQVNNNIITISLEPDQTAALTGKKYVYDVKVSDLAGVVTRVVEGYVTVTPAVT
jgi:hypothetical protein